MLESIPFVIAIGSILGFLAGLGVGGGSLLILWLGFVIHIPQDTARSINLMFFLPAALISCFLRWKQGKLCFKKLLPAILAGSAAAIVFTFLGKRIPTDYLRAPFGILLLYTGIREIFYRDRKAR